MRRLAVLAAALALVPGASAGGDVGVFGLRYGKETNTVVRLGVRLQPVGTPIRLDAYAYAWSLNGDGGRLVAAHARRAALRFVDLFGGRVEGTLRLPSSGRVGGTAWVGDRVLAVAGRDVFAVDSRERRVAGRARLPGTVISGVQTRAGLVLLLGPAGRVGAARLAVVGAGARVRSVALPRTRAGTRYGETTTMRRPALVVDGSGTRAFVLGAGEPPATVDLRTLAVRYAAGRTLASARKLVDGSVRVGAWVAGRVVLSGADYRAGEPGLPAGVRVLDPTTWAERVLDDEAATFSAGGGLVFLVGRGLRAVSPDGTQRFALFERRGVASVAVAGRRALVRFGGRTPEAAVVDLGTRRVVARTARPPVLLAGPGAPLHD